MNAKLKARWVKALRSGKYKQCTGALTDGPGFCCLGVLHSLVYKKVPERWESMPLRIKLSDAVVQELADRNDGLGKHKRHTFKQIADYIEAKL